ncbi:hypothetical protein BC936DRAFT_140453 [Jimgerdemannia flammicorona]|uniref:Uncharacterized protein n=1 Tax=Jimgerdemannia flammicorona TaxID=994334 RepID=A0A433AU95_9FUNG|nr:hypothetical protein BC936DRAFT_140453 [Jimgerdemannia flammicorona]
MARDSLGVDYKPPFYKTKKFWIICVILIIVIVVILVPVLLLVAFPKIAQSNIDSSSIYFNDVNITFSSPNINTVTKRDGVDWNNTFTISMSGGIGNAGAIGATIDFPTPITVSWNGFLLGSLTLPSVTISGGNGQLLSSTTFTINDTNVFGNFSKYLLSETSFTWVLDGRVTVHALGRTIEDLSLHKEVTMQGMGGFPDVRILEFNLPGDDPQGGINMTIATELQNPSPISVQLGTIVLNIGYGNTFIGPVTAKNVILVGRSGTNITLSGRMLPQTTPEALAQISDLMSRYIGNLVSNTVRSSFSLFRIKSRKTAAGVSAAPDGVNPVNWLSEGFKSVTLKVPLQAPSGIQLITGITLGSMNLAFNAQTPYAPMASSDNVSANFKMPFGFTLNITQVEQNMTIATFKDGGIASLQSTWGNATSNLGAGLLSFKLNNAPLQVLPGKELAFNDFTTGLTLGSQYNFSVIGNSTVGASTPIGNVILSHIPFNANTSLQGW